MCTQSPTSARLARQSGSWPPWPGPVRMALAPRLPISFRLFSPQRKKARSFAPKLWSTFPTQFQNMSLLKCSAQCRFCCHGATPAVVPLGSGQYLHDRPGRRIDAARRDDVARERIARPDAVDIPAGRRVVNPDQVARGVHETAEVAVLHRLRRRRAEQRRGRAFPVLLAGEQEERLVLPDRTVDAEPVLIDVLIGLRCAARVEQERVGGQRLAPHEVVDRRRGTSWCPTSATC